MTGLKDFWCLRLIMYQCPNFLGYCYNSRNSHAKAVEVGNRLLSSPSVQFIHVDEVLFFEAWRLFQQYDDKSYSLTDCVSFVVMKRLGISTALSFDKHFVQAGFEKLP